MAKDKPLSSVKLPGKDYRHVADWHNVIAWYQDSTGSVQLSPREEQLRERLDFCDNLIRKYGTRTRVVPMLRKKFPEMSQKVAYDIYNQTQMAFGSIARASKEYWRDIYASMLMEDREAAILRGDRRTAIEAVKAAGKIRRLDKVDEEEEKPALPQTVIIQYQQHSLGLVAISEEEAKKVLAQVLRPKKKKDYGMDIEDALILNESDGDDDNAE